LFAKTDYFDKNAHLQEKADAHFLVFRKRKIKENKPACDRGAARSSLCTFDLGRWPSAPIPS
jgi:hypothetical protein